MLAVVLASVTAVVAFTIAAICCTRARKLAKRADRISTEMNQTHARSAPISQIQTATQQHVITKPYQLTTFVMQPGVYGNNPAFNGESDTPIALSHPFASSSGLNVNSQTHAISRDDQARHVQAVLNPTRRARPSQANGSETIYEPIDITAHCSTSPIACRATPEYTEESRTETIMAPKTKCRVQINKWRGKDE